MTSLPSEPDRREKLLYLVLSVIATVVLIALIYAAGVREEEEYGVGVYSTLLNARSIFSGEPALWTNLRGFGTPLPLGQSFYFDPTFYLWPTLPISAVMMLFWAKMAAGSFCLGLWLRKIGASPLTTVLGGFCFIFSIPVANATVTDDWPSVLSSWALFPVVLLLIAHLSDTRRPYAVGIALGAVAGLWAANGHPGHLPVYIIPAAVYTCVLIFAYPRILGPLAVGGVIASLAVLDDVYYILQQLSLFPEGIERGGYGPLTLGDYRTSLWRPFSFYDFTQWQEGQDFNRFFRDSFQKGSTRYPFVGLGLIVGIPVSVFALLRMPPAGRVHALGVVAALLTAFYLSLAPKSVLSSGASAMWLFRDSVLVMAIAAGVLGLTFLQKMRWGMFAVVPLLTIQVLQTTLVFGEPVLFGVCCDDEYGVFPAADTVTPAKQVFLDVAASNGPRMALSDYLSGRMTLGRFDDQGIHSASDLSLAGVELVSGRFKGTSHDTIFPSNGLWGGNIRFPIDSFRNGRMLDITGISVVGMYRNELNDQPPPAGLTEIAAVDDDRGNEVVLFSNEDAWQRVTLLPAGRDLNMLPVVRDDRGCVKPALWCTVFKDFPEPLAEQPTGVIVTRRAVAARIPPATGDRVAFVSQLLRDGWHAEIDGELLLVRPAVNGAFFSVQVPAKGGMLTVSYDVGIRYWIFWFSLATIWAAALVAVFLFVRPGSKESRQVTRP